MRNEKAIQEETKINKEIDKTTKKLNMLLDKRMQIAKKNR